MKKINIIIIGCLATMLVLPVSCVDDLLNQQPPTQISSSIFWKTENDALQALYGVYSSVRPCFDRDFLYDAQGEFMKSHNNLSVIGTEGNFQLGHAYRSTFLPSSGLDTFDEMFRYLYGGIHHSNYVIDNVQKMLTTVSAENVNLRTRLQTIVAEARFLRGLCYFRLISMWGDVPAIWNIVEDESEVSTISRTPIGVIKDSILSDFSFASNNLPVRRPSAELGRATKPAAIALRGKVQLFWACWNNFGWPELKDFSPNANSAREAYAAAAADFKTVIEDFGLNLFRDGEPGECDELGKAEKLPNYYYLFIPTTGNGAEEHLFVFTHGGQASAQSEELMRILAGRTLESSQGNVYPRFEIMNRYQSTITGDFCPPLVHKNRNSAPDHFTAENSSLNPQSYTDRDYRMKATILFEYEQILGLASRVATGMVPWLYQVWNVPITAANYQDYPGLSADDIGKTTYWSDSNASGVFIRKFIRNYAGLTRSEGNFHWPVIRLADVYLMYAEAINEVNGGPDELAIELLNKIRHRGNLPALAADKTANKEEFFNAVEQERIVELFGEGQRGFDLRRWRAIQRVWCGPRNPDGIWTRDSWGTNRDRFFQNASELTFERCYIYRIPRAERERNPNLSQNTPWQ